MFVIQYKGDNFFECERGTEADNMDKFVLHSPFSPTGDQPEAIDGLVRGIEAGYGAQTLLKALGYVNGIQIPFRFWHDPYLRRLIF